MNHRQDPRVIPETGNVIEVRVPSGVYHFLMPGQRRVWADLRAVNAELAGRMGGTILTEGLDEGVFGFLFVGWGDDACAALGLLLGLTWHHRTQDLTTPALTPDGDRKAYGLAVWDELEADGVPYNELIMLGTALLKTVTDATVVDLAAIQRADFFGPTRARSGGGTSPSGGSTAAIPGHGIASPTNSGSTSSPSAGLTGSSPIPGP